MRDSVCLSADVLRSDEYLESSPEAKALYVQLPFYADIDGFVSCAKSVVREIGVELRHISELESNGLIYVIDGLVLIRHWWINNSCGSMHYERYSKHKPQLSMVRIDGTDEIRTSKDGKQTVFKYGTYVLCQEYARHMPGINQAHAAQKERKEKKRNASGNERKEVNLPSSNKGFCPNCRVSLAPDESGFYCPECGETF